MRGLLIATLAIILFTEVVFQITIIKAPLWLSENMVFFSLADNLPYILLAIALWKSHRRPIGKGYPWFLLAAALYLLISLLYLFVVKEINFNSMLFVQTFHGLLAPYIKAIYEDYGFLAYFLPMVVLAVASLVCTKNRFMKTVSLVSFLVISLAIVLKATLGWQLMSWLAVFIWISGLIWNSRSATPAAT
jgi:hypothetical protein